MLRTWAAIESWASGAKLGVIRELVRRESGPRDGGQHGDLPDEWSQSLRHELAAALACSTQSAETTTWLVAAMGCVNARAEEYKDSDAFGDTQMDVLRAQAYLDLLNGVPAHARIAAAEPQDDAADAAEALAWAEARAAKGMAGARDDAGHVDRSGRADGDEGEPDNGGGPGPDDRGPEPGCPPAGLPFKRRPADLIVPLVTLLGLAERPGEVQGFGLLDPGLARDLAAVAVASPGTEVCVTVTSPEGYAIGHGCARPEHRSRPGQAAATPGVSPPGLPARLNLTIPATALPGLTGNHGRAGPWAFIPRGSPASPARTPASPARTGQGPPPNGYGTWVLTFPDGRRFTVRLDPLPTFGCDHAYETHRYQPSDKLRHLVQVRDGTCTFPPCSRHARESDFEHALPYDKGGRTCTCNAGARSRACHRVKQSPGWNVTQPRPGKRGSYCPPVQAFDGLSELVAVPEAIRLRHSASVSGVRVIRCRAPGPRRAVRMPCLIQS
jgi:hypothetical protein